jgi:hypothetical protein
MELSALAIFAGALIVSAGSPGPSVAQTGPALAPWAKRWRQSLHGASDGTQSSFVMAGLDPAILFGTIAPFAKFLARRLSLNEARSEEDGRVKPGHDVGYMQVGS